MNGTSRHERLRRRAELLSRLRSFFVERGFLEVETPLLDGEIIPELHIEPFAVNALQPRALPGGNLASAFYLQASPELHMKRLLAEGLPAIYQITRSFRRGERGQLHNPEFTIVEWYRAGDGMEEGVALLSELCTAVADAPPATRTTYAKAFQKYAGVDPHHASIAELASAASKLGVPAPEGHRVDDRNEWLNLLLATQIEPNLGASGPEILLDYPASQSAIAATTTRPDGTVVAERFEVYWQGVELANGYYELTDAAELRNRLDHVNAARVADCQPALPMPERLLAAMESPGLPPCSGCALGFDRLAMLALGAASIDEVMAFP